MPGIGDVVTIEGYNDLHVIVDFKNNENMSSMSYDRDYFVLPLETVKNMDILDKSKAIKIHITGIEMTPKITTVPHEAPFEFKEVKYYTVRRKQVKSVTVWE